MAAVPHPDDPQPQHEQLLGRGKNGTVVYLATQIPARFAPASCVRASVLLLPSSDRRPASVRDTGCVPASDRAALAAAGLGADVAVKDVRDRELAETELAVHALVRRMFSVARDLGACSVHPRVLALSVDGRPLLPMRVGLPLGRVRPDELLPLAGDALRALAVLHRNGVLHLDVKPQNVLRLPQPSGGRRFLLADYDIAAHAEDVLDAARDGPVQAGTRGYVSPLLLGRLETAVARCCMHASSPAARRAAERCGLGRLPRFDETDWQLHFASLRHRILLSDSAEALFTADLHSLAVTLHRLRSASPSSSAVSALISGLMYGSFGGAREAAAFVRAQQQKKCKPQRE